MNDWLQAAGFFASPEYYKIRDFLKAERDAGKSILPAENDIFNALKYTPIDRVKVVIVGQDPYPNKRHAHGLCFSIPKTTKDIPKSLANILKELKADLGIETTNGNLTKWTEQGVLLLNRVLTVEEGKSNSHKGIGWEKLTEEIIRIIDQRRNNVVFLLWGAHAQKCSKFITEDRHYIIEAPHPSPLSAYRGFFGSRPFSKANEYLEANGMVPIDWNT
ncbi:MAG: uracil-DNA glycosylase [Promethearchaeota archaeon]